MHREVVFVLLVFCLGILVLIRQIFPHLFVSLRKIREFRGIFSRIIFFNMMVSFGFILSLTLAISVAPFSKNHEIFSLSWGFVSLLGLFLSFYFLRYLVLSLFFFAIKQTKNMSRVTRIKSFFKAWQMIGFLMFIPLVAFSLLSSQTLFWCFLTLFGILFFTEIFYTGVCVHTKEAGSTSVFYIILYLCAFEILPLAVVYKSLFFR